MDKPSEEDHAWGNWTATVTGAESTFYLANCTWTPHQGSLTHTYVGQEYGVTADPAQTDQELQGDP